MNAISSGTNKVEITLSEFNTNYLSVSYVKEYKERIGRRCLVFNFLYYPVITIFIKFGVIIVQ